MAIGEGVILFTSRPRCLSPKMFVNDLRVIQGYVQTLTIGAVKQRAGSNVNDYIAHLWQIGHEQNISAR